jgi:RHS repeat-associated protein
MAMPGRHYDAGVGYRYGFNGKEQDKDINSLTAYDYGFRIYNPGIGRFLSVDPLTKRYPNYSTYQFSGNNPVMFVDIDGLERGWRNPITGEIKEAGPVSGVDGIQNSDGWILFTAIKSSGEIGASFGVPKRSLPISSSQLQPSSDYLVSVRTIQVHQSVLRRTVPQKKFEIDIVQQDIYGIAHIGKESEVHAEVEGAKAQYQAAVGDNIRGGLWGATGYLIGGDKGSFYGAIADNIVLSFAGVPGNSNILSRRPIELEQQKVPALNEDIKIRENSVSHIFTNEHGLQNTVANRQVLLDLARSKENLLGVDKFGNEWYAQLNVEGKQIWAQVRNGEIFNGGVNNSPKSFDPLTGLSKNLNDLKNK